MMRAVDVDLLLDSSKDEDNFGLSNDDRRELLEEICQWPNVDEEDNEVGLSIGLSDEEQKECNNEQKECDDGKRVILIQHMDSYVSDTDDEEEDDDVDDDDVEIAACWRPKICLLDLTNLSLGNVKTKPLAPLFCIPILAVADPLIEVPEDPKPKGIVHEGIYFN